jgi:hypothetical protein
MNKDKKQYRTLETCVSKCMVGCVKGKISRSKTHDSIRLGTSNYMASFIKEEFPNLNFEEDKHSVEKNCNICY